MKIHIYLIRISRIFALATSLSACVSPGAGSDTAASGSVQASASSSGAALSADWKRHTSTSVSTSTATSVAASCSFNGSTISSGGSVTAFQASSVPNGQSCASQTRTCLDGVLSGTYIYASCSVADSAVPVNLLANGDFSHGLASWNFIITSPDTGTQYQDNSKVPNGIAWSEAVQVWNAVSGSNYYVQLNHAVGALEAGVPVTVSFMATSSVPGFDLEVGVQNRSNWSWFLVNGGIPQFRLSTDWAQYSFTFTPSAASVSNQLNFDFGSAAANIWIANVTLSTGSAPAGSNAACNFNGSLVASGSSVTAYQASNVPYGQACVSQVRSCLNGVLSGTYSNAACSVLPPASCSFAGALIASGQSVTAYQAASVVSPDACVSQTETCNNGVMSGSYAYASCSVSSSPASASLPPPAGYSAAQLIFEDTFTAASLNSSKWNIGDGTANQGPWYNGLPAPYTSGGTQFMEQYFSPTQVSTGPNGLTLTAVLDSTFASQGYSWKSGAIYSGNKVTVPASGGYVQFLVKMPDMSAGIWPALWFLGPNSDNEYDLIDAGFTGPGGPNYCMTNKLFAGNFAGTQENTGINLSGQFVTYGVEFRAGQSIKAYINGVLQNTVTVGVPSTINYEILISLQVANSATAGWHSTPTSSTLSPSSMSIKDVQIYNLP